MARPRVEEGDRSLGAAARRRIDQLDPVDLEAQERLGEVRDLEADVVEALALARPGSGRRRSCRRSARRARSSTRRPRGRRSGPGRRGCPSTVSSSRRERVAPEAERVLDRAHDQRHVVDAAEAAGRRLGKPLRSVAIGGIGAAYPVAHGSTADPTSGVVVRVALPPALARLRARWRSRGIGRRASRTSRSSSRSCRPTGSVPDGPARPRRDRRASRAVRRCASRGSTASRRSSTWPPSRRRRSPALTDGDRRRASRDHPPYGGVVRGGHPAPDDRRVGRRADLDDDRGRGRARRCPFARRVSPARGARRGRRAAAGTVAGGSRSAVRP